MESGNHLTYPQAGVEWLYRVSKVTIRLSVNTKFQFTICKSPQTILRYCIHTSVIFFSNAKCLKHHNCFAIFDHPLYIKGNEVALDNKKLGKGNSNHSCPL